MERSIMLRNLAVVVVVLLIGVLAWFWMSQRSDEAGRPVEPDADVAQPPVATVPVPPVVSPDPESWAGRLATVPVWPERLDEPGDCDTVDRELASVCAALDAGPHGLGGRSSCAVVKETVAALLASPPRASAELRRHADVLRNVHHVFRVLGRERINDARALARDRELVEAGALTLYRWIGSRAQCDPQSPSVGRTAMYDYASFAFTTLGGQAYLRRRAPAVEAIACFWALHVLDHSIVAGHNPNGVDPRREIDRCRALVSTQPLVFRERYEERFRQMALTWTEDAR